MTAQLLLATFNGLVAGMAVFLVAAGLTLVFGILKIFNFSHGAFFMVGAYLAHAVIGSEPSSLAMFLVAALGAAVVVGALGIAADLLVFRRLANVSTEYTLIATFAILLMCNGATRLIFGDNVYAVYPPDALDRLFDIGIPVAAYALFILVSGVAVFVALEVGLNRLWFGKLAKAVARDPWMSGVIGLRVERIKLVSVGVSFALAGLAGALLVANQSLSLDLGNAYLLLAFNCVIVGGLGSIRGAFVAALIFGMIESFSSILTPGAPEIFPYVALIAMILIKPSGLYPEVA